MPNVSLQDVYDRLDYLAVTKDLIRGAILSKGVSVLSTDNFRDYAERIQSIGGEYTIPDGNEVRY